MFKLIVLSALVAVASAGVLAPYAYNHGIAPAVSYAPTVSYHAPLATSYANSYKVAYAAPTVTKVISPPVTKIAYAAPSVAYSAPIYSHGYSGLGYGHNSAYGLGYGGGYGYGNLGYGYGHGYGSGYGHGYIH